MALRVKLHSLYTMLKPLNKLIRYQRMPSPYRLFPVQWDI